MLRINPSGHTGRQATVHLKSSQQTQCSTETILSSPWCACALFESVNTLPPRVALGAHLGKVPSRAHPRLREISGVGSLPGTAPRCVLKRPGPARPLARRGGSRCPLCAGCGTNTAVVGTGRARARRTLATRPQPTITSRTPASPGPARLSGRIEGGKGGRPGLRAPLPGLRPLPPPPLSAPPPARPRPWPCPLRPCTPDSAFGPSRSGPARRPISMAVSFAFLCLEEQPPASTWSEES